MRTGASSRFGRSVRACRPRRRFEQDLLRAGTRGGPARGHEKPRPPEAPGGAGGRRDRLRGRPGRGRGLPRPERRREDDNAEDALWPALSDLGRGARPRPRAREARARVPAPDHARDGEPEPAPVGSARTRLVRAEPGDLPDPARRFRASSRRADRTARRRRPRAQARAEPLARRADEGRGGRITPAPAPGALPRRADDRARRDDAEADSRVRGRVQPALRRDRPADEPLHGRCGRALPPRGRHPPRQDSLRRPARPARRGIRGVQDADRRGHGPDRRPLQLRRRARPRGRARQAPRPKGRDGARHGPAARRARRCRPDGRGSAHRGRDRARVRAGAAAGAAPVSTAEPEAGAVRSYLDYYLTRARVQIQSNFQYRVATYIVWTLVRNMNIVFTPYGWEWRIREGELSAALLRPLHPIHEDIAGFAGWKVVTIILCLPIAAVLWIAFDPVFDVRAAEIAAFCVAIWGAYLIRTMFLTSLGMVTFWTTRVSALFELAVGLELLLSGRLVPLPLMPDWAEDVANLLPFKWSFYFPIETLVGDMSNEELLRGLGIQLLWIVALTGLFLVVWRFAIRRYSAVGD